MIEHKFRVPYEIVNRAKIIWAMNDLPRILSPNDGIYRRAMLLEVPALEPGAKRPEILDNVPNEGPGILNWALEGLRRLEARGWKFDVPAEIALKTAEWKTENDQVSQFLNDWYEVDPSLPASSSVERAELYRYYKLWTTWENKQARFVLGRKAFNEGVRRTNLKDTKVSGLFYWEGLTMSEDGEDEAVEAKGETNTALPSRTG